MARTVKNALVVNTALAEVFLIYNLANKGIELHLAADVLFLSLSQQAAHRLSQRSQSD